MSTDHVRHTGYWESYEASELSFPWFCSGSLTTIILLSCQWGTTVELVMWSSATQTSTASYDSLLYWIKLCWMSVCVKMFNVHVSAVSIMYFFLALFFKLNVNKKQKTLGGKRRHCLRLVSKQKWWSFLLTKVLTCSSVILLAFSPVVSFHREFSLSPVKEILISFCPKPGIGLPLRMAYEYALGTASVSPDHITSFLPCAWLKKQNPEFTGVRKNSAAFKSLSVEKIKALTCTQRQCRWCCFIIISSKPLIHSSYTSVVEDKSTLGENGASAWIGGSSGNMFHIRMCVLLKV